MGPTTDLTVNIHGRQPMYPAPNVRRRPLEADFAGYGLGQAPVCPRPLVMAKCLAGIAIAIPIPTGFPTQCWKRNWALGTSKGYPVIRQMADELAHHESHAVDSIHHNDIPPTHTTMFQQQGTRAPQHPYERRFFSGGLSPNARQSRILGMFFLHASRET